jgi:hypothetical protein
MSTPLNPATWVQMWAIGRRVQEIDAPHRKGTIKARRGTGEWGILIVNLDGGHPQNFYSKQLKLLPRY